MTFYFEDHCTGLSLVSTLFVGRTESYAKSYRTSSQGAVGLSLEALTSF